MCYKFIIFKNKVKEMRKGKKTSTAISIVFILMFVSVMILTAKSAYGNFDLFLSSLDTNGIPICTDGNPKVTGDYDRGRETRICTDMEGGAYIVWSDERFGSGNETIYVQRVNASGGVQWKKDGIALCNSTHSQTLPIICSDLMEGVIIAWREWRDGYLHIIAQRINSFGNILWNSDGVLISNANNNKYHHEICSDGYGGAIITWASGSVRVQRINSTGQLKWTNKGIYICNGGSYPKICADGDGGAVIAWEDFRNEEISGIDIYAQKVNSTGDAQWANNGVEMCGWATHELDHKICSDGKGGAVVAYRDYLPNSHEHVRIQGINSSGIVKWGIYGIGISNNSDRYPWLDICSDDSSGSYITWNDNNKNAICVQHANSTGHVQWIDGGVAVSKKPGASRIFQDGFGGVIVTWYQIEVVWNDRDIYAQRLDVNGDINWETNGTKICTADEIQVCPELCNDGSGGAIIVWNDFRTDLDLYAQRINSTGDVLWFITREDPKGGGIPLELIIVISSIVGGGILVAVVVVVLVRRKRK